METYSSQGSPAKEPFDSEAAENAFIKNYTSSRARISVEGFYPDLTEDEIKSELTEHFKSCGNVCRVDVPREPLLDRRAFVILLGDGVKEKALQLNGSDMGGWKALVKFAPEQEEEEFQVESAYRESLFAKLTNDKRFMFGVAVEGYDTSLPEDDIESKLTAHFSSCGKITHVFVSPLDKCTNIYFSKEEGEASALDLDGTQVDGFEITTTPVVTVRSNPPLAPGETRIGYTVPAHLIEFAGEIEEKVNAYMFEWRVKAMKKKIGEMREQRIRARRVQKIRASRVKAMAKREKEQRIRQQSIRAPREQFMRVSTRMAKRERGTERIEVGGSGSRVSGCL